MFDGDTIGGQEGLFLSLEHWYPPGTNCTFVIRGRANEIARLTFPSFKIRLRNDAMWLNRMVNRKRNYSEGFRKILDYLDISGVPFCYVIYILIYIIQMHTAIYTTRRIENPINSSRSLGDCRESLTIFDSSWTEGRKVMEAVVVLCEENQYLDRDESESGRSSRRSATASRGRWKSTTLSPRATHSSSTSSR